jgi:formamidopyrimidine-DNA glycosylase
MPELPEVETMMRLVAPALEGRVVRETEVEWLRTLRGVSRARFCKVLVGRRMVRIYRRAKFILIDLELRRRPAGHLVIHLGMTGRLYVAQKGAPPVAHERVRLRLDDGSVFVFLDVRKFGRFTFTEELESALPKLGPEPLGEEFTPEWFRSALRSFGRQLKPLLLDQSFVAGLGNIYVDESLHAARLHPLRRAKGLPAAAADRLHGAIRRILTEAILREGSSFDTFYRTPEGQPGSYQHQFGVYGRDGRPCRSCGAPIRKLVVGGRGTHVCLRCQRPPRKGQAVV